MANASFRKKAHHMNHIDLTLAGGGDSEMSETLSSDIKQDLHGWREVLLPLESLLLWEQPYYPAILVGTTTFLFSIVWYTEISALTAFSLVGIILGIIDFVVPFVGPTVTGYKTWTEREEIRFSSICEKIAAFQQDVIDTYHGLSAMRQHNAKMFFFIVMGILTSTAWIGNLIDNLFLTYLMVNFFLLTPGLRHHKITQKYLQPIFNRFKSGNKDKSN
ncbi:ADP-ribosylation factor-like protein 6-interacting protein 1 [Biomphalaria glabrata]|uniref:ADP-ribosylation factor-like protein 6-interacting protein 1 isoform X3 n=1 Tax=Biomphalaria glabrata TaxID=6526 RepID=A0A9W2ZT28_BIOGL|nr:ADP-ribosylation factor-like protein 6-interacting protein 1 isoform X3 [Biomphalaria glabrata]KAI8766186.1 ADP-ribosylation factor-like protein 6-interacting protein 1 isoform X1 [Biomphalaria glabrata]